MPRPYTYRLENQSGDWYIGVRVANKVPAEQDTSYMGSSKYVKARIKAGEVFTKHILGEYETNEEACEAESALLREHKDKPGRINKTCGHGFTYIMDDEVKTLISRGAVKAHADPEVKLKRQKIYQSDEFKAQASLAGKRAHGSDDARKKHAENTKLGLTEDVLSLRRKTCTVDGITIYKSLRHLVDALGKGYSGSRSPNFRYTEKV